MGFAASRRNDDGSRDVVGMEMGAIAAASWVVIRIRPRQELGRISQGKINPFARRSPALSSLLRMAWPRIHEDPRSEMTPLVLFPSRWRRVSGKPQRVMVRALTHAQTPMLKTAFAGGWISVESTDQDLNL
jgi:hypothetical protein